MKVLVIGSGGREHAISWALAKSDKVSQVICVPGNGGTAIENKCKNVDAAKLYPQLSSLDAIAKLAEDEKPYLVVVGPEDPLAAGLADKIWAKGIPVVGPKSQGAALEASKDLSKIFMEKYSVACAKSKTVTDAKEAHKYIDEHGAPIVVKADGLAAGKGVVVALDLQQAHDAIDSFMGDKTLGDAGNKIVLEDYLQGVEISVLAAVSVTEKTQKPCIIPFTTARDHKRLNDGAKGPNTGGMGAIAPVADVTKEQLDLFDKNILQPTLKGLIAEKMDYRGFIFFGVMLCKDGPKLLEYNVRLGDPETQAVLPLMDFDFYEMCSAIIDGSLADFDFKWKKGFVCAPVAVSGGYPASYKKGYTINIDKTSIEKNGSKVFIAGGILDTDKNLKTSGGRVLACSAYGDTFDEAWKKSYEAINYINFTDMFYRKDIGLPGAAESK